MMKKNTLITSLLLVLSLIYVSFPVSAASETVYVKYRGQVDLAPFDCEWVSRSSFIKRLCYDPKEEYAIVNLSGTYYHYCEVPATVITAWRQADSMGRYYNAHVKGQFDCRVLHVPSYKN